MEIGLFPLQKVKKNEPLSFHDFILEPMWQDLNKPILTNITVEIRKPAKKIVKKFLETSFSQHFARFITSWIEKYETLKFKAYIV